MSDTVTWYRATAHTWSEVPIKPVEVFRETQKTLLIESYGRKRRTNKIGPGARYFPTEREAVAWRREQLSKQLDDATEEVKRLSRELFKLEADYPAE